MTQVPGSTDVTHVVFILDASGSMSSIRGEAIELFNGQVSAIRTATENGRSTVSFATFGTESRPIMHYVGEPIERLEPLTHETYRPQGLTPMLDAIGWMCERVEGELVKSGEDYSVLVVIVSDGQENHSGRWQASVPATERHRAYTGEEIQLLVTRLEATDRWTFTFLGANVDLKNLSRELGIKEGNIRQFNSTKEGMLRARADLAFSSDRYMQMKKMGMKKMDDFYIDAIPGEPGTGTCLDEAEETFPLEFINRHLIITVQGQRLLIDTGSPVSSGNDSIEICGRRHRLPSRFEIGPFGIDLIELSGFVGTPLDGILGLDIIGKLAMRIDARAGRLDLATMALKGGDFSLPIQSAPLPMIRLELEGRRISLIWDTGACHSYLIRRDLLENCPEAGMVKDFHPLIGHFETMMHAVNVQLGPHSIPLQFGQLPQMLEGICTRFGIQGVLGNELLGQFQVLYDPFGHRLVMTAY